MWNTGSGKSQSILVFLLWLGISLFVFFDAINNPAPWELIFGLFVTGVAVAAIGHFPVISLSAAASSALTLIFDLGGRFPVWPFFLTVLVCYLAGRRINRARPALLVFVTVAIAGALFAWIFRDGDLSSWGIMIGGLTLGGLFPWQLGRYARLREELARAGWRQAEEMESRQRSIANQAQLQERARIASDMHDLLGHELSLIAVRAAVLEMASTLDEAQRRAASELRESAAEATEQLRQILDVLRQEVVPVELEKESITELIDRAIASGMFVRSELDDTDSSAMPPMVHKAVYRVVQESFTNAAKHAPGAAVTVRISHSDKETTVAVVNKKPPAGPLPIKVSGRRGLPGLRERVRLLGGTLLAEPRDGGFAVEARLPHNAMPDLKNSKDSGIDYERSESSRELERARKEIRRGLIRTFVIPIGLFVGMFALSGTLFLYNWYGSRLEAAQYSRIHIGQEHEEIVSLLPTKQRLGRVESIEPPAPPNARCEYYGTERSIFNLTYETYRLCFINDRLVSKDLIRDEDEKQ